MMKSIFKILVIALITTCIQSCKSVDLRTNTVLNTPNSNEQKGKELLKEAVIAMGYDKLADTQVYEVTAQFDWKSVWLIMPMNALPGNNKNDLQFRFATNSFDGQVELSGRP